MEERYVVVTTKHRGVFGGFLSSEDGDVVVLTNCRNCIYWTADVNGFGGLAVTGPLTGCKIGPTVPIIKLRGVTAILDCEKAAQKSWTAWK